MKLHLWDGESATVWCGKGGRGRHRLLGHLAKVREVPKGMLVEHCADDLPDLVCRSCRRSMATHIGHGWWWRRVGGGKWLAQRLKPAAE